MNAYLPRQHSCCRGSEGADLARGVPTLPREAHCPCGWRQNSQGGCCRPQALPLSASGPHGPTLTQPRTKCSTSWDNVQKSPPKTLAKAKGAGGEWWTDCTCPHSWYHPLQVRSYFPLSLSNSMDSQSPGRKRKGKVTHIAFWIIKFSSEGWRTA